MNEPNDYKRTRFPSHLEAEEQWQLITKISWQASNFTSNKNHQDLNIAEYWTSVSNLSHG